MAKIQRVQKSRKETRCCKCGTVIPVGSSYLYAEPAFRPKIVRCVKCGLEPYETSSSDYIQTVGRICSKWQEDYGCDETTAESIMSDLEDLKDQCEENYDNIPEQLQDGDAGSTLQERIDNLEEVMNELDIIDYESMKDEAVNSTDITISKEDYVKFCKDHDCDASDADELVDEDENIEINLSDLPGDLDYDELIELDFISESDKDSLRYNFEAALSEAIDEALGYLEY